MVHWRCLVAFKGFAQNLPNIQPVDFVLYNMRIFPNPLEVEVLNWLFVCQRSNQRCDVCVKWELVWVGLPCFVQHFGFCSSSNELWKPWLQLECLIATEKREGELVNRGKARGDHVLLSKGHDSPDNHCRIFCCEDEIKLDDSSCSHYFFIYFFLLWNDWRNSIFLD